MWSRFRVSFCAMTASTSSAKEGCRLNGNEEQIAIFFEIPAEVRPPSRANIGPSETLVGATRAGWQIHRTPVPPVVEPLGQGVLASWDPVKRGARQCQNRSNAATARATQRGAKISTCFHFSMKLVAVVDLFHWLWRLFSQLATQNTATCNQRMTKYLVTKYMQAKGEEKGMCVFWPIWILMYTGNALFVGPWVDFRFLEDSAVENLLPGPVRTCLAP